MEVDGSREEKTSENINATQYKRDRFIESNF